MDNKCARCGYSADESVFKDVISSHLECPRCKNRTIDPVVHGNYDNNKNVETHLDNQKIVDTIRERKRLHESLMNCN